jgi:hypothetical protein
LWIFHCSLGARGGGQDFGCGGEGFAGGEAAAQEGEEAVEGELEEGAVFGEVAEESAGGVFLDEGSWGAGSIGGGVGDLGGGEVVGGEAKIGEAALEVDFFDVEEELFVEAVDGVPGVAGAEEAGTGGPVDGALLDAVNGEVFSVERGAELIEEEIVEGGEAADGGLDRAVGVEEGGGDAAGGGWGEVQGGEEEGGGEIFGEEEVGVAEEAPGGGGGVCGAVGGGAVADVWAFDDLEGGGELSGEGEGVVGGAGVGEEEFGGEGGAGEGVVPGLEEGGEPAGAVVGDDDEGEGGVGHRGIILSGGGRGVRATRGLKRRFSIRLADILRIRPVPTHDIYWPFSLPSLCAGEPHDYFGVQGRLGGMGGDEHAGGFIVLEGLLPGAVGTSDDDAVVIHVRNDGLDLGQRVFVDELPLLHFGERRGADPSAADLVAAPDVFCLRGIGAPHLHGLIGRDPGIVAIDDFHIALEVHGHIAQAIGVMDHILTGEVHDVGVGNPFGDGLICPGKREVAGAEEIDRVQDNRAAGKLAGLRIKGRSAAHAAGGMKQDARRRIVNMHRIGRGVFIADDGGFADVVADLPFHPGDGNGRGRGIAQKRFDDGGLYPGGTVGA